MMAVFQNTNEKNGFLNNLFAITNLQSLKACYFGRNLFE